MGRVWIGVLALGLLSENLRATESPALSISFVFPGGNSENAPLHLDANFAAVSVEVRNLSDRPLRISGDQGGNSPLTFRLDLDDGRSLFLTQTRYFGSWSGPREEFLLQPGESGTLPIRFGPREKGDLRPSWTWDESQVKGHRALLVPIYITKPPGAAITGRYLDSLWTGEMEGKGIPVSFP